MLWDGNVSLKMKVELKMNPASWGARGNILGRLTVREDTNHGVILATPS